MHKLNFFFNSLITEKSLRPYERPEELYYVFVSILFPVSNFCSSCSLLLNQRKSRNAKLLLKKSIRLLFDESPEITFNAFLCCVYFQLIIVLI